MSDASGGGWPLYARIDITAEGGFAGATLFTDPVTGYYQVSLVGAAVYHFHVAAVTTGYTLLLRDVPLDAAPAGGGGSRPPELRAARPTSRRAPRRATAAR